MSKTRSASKIKMMDFDDLFGKSPSEEVTENVPFHDIDLSELHDFNNHPFKVLDDEKMLELVESIKENGVLMPGIARPRVDGGYEIISGHRRKHACEMAGLTSMPMVVHEYTDNEATIIMVDSNIQRENILPSEKAKAYSMKYEAMKQQGKKNTGLSLDNLGKLAGEGKSTVQRYIQLARLSPTLLDMVDHNKISLVAGVSLSALTGEQQGWVEKKLERDGVKISPLQAEEIKKYGEEGSLTETVIEVVLKREKSKSRKIVIKEKEINKYFPDDEYSSEDIEKIIFELLESWKKRS